MRGRKLTILVVAGLTVQGCATMSEQECLVSDWHAVGYEDGVRGQSADRIGKYRKACAEHGVAPDLAAYRQGREAGLREFCQPENGFDFGSRGGTYRGGCPADLADDFEVSYWSGRKLYDLESSIRSASSQISAKRRRMDEIEDEMTAAAVRLIAEETSTEERAAMLTKTKNMAEERSRLDAEIEDLVADRARREQELSAYRAQLASSY